ncbi:MAG TPA: YARHG domain-containing protein [Pyrinomonadaceae bacterium]|nr:YARHG domain-containing protein [Pyrinomonadaceae bacterium]
MNRKLIVCLSFLLIALVFAQNNAFAQDDLTGYETARKEGWKEFNKQNWHKFDFTKRKITRARLKKLDVAAAFSQLELLRGVVFGKRGRVFKERSIQDYLEAQSWYKPSPKFTNALLTRMERDNLDLIRLEEAERHESVEPGDMRIWQAKLITDEKLRVYSPAELSILIAEIEAIHGKTFPEEEWLQKYFDERYWYKRNPNYAPTALSETERKNLETLFAQKGNNRNTAIAIGDMDNFQNVLLTEDKLKGLTLMELRMIRNEFWARRGKKFAEAGIRQYFDWRDWYRPAKNQKTVKLNAVEQQNVSLIEAYEAKLREKLSTEILTEETLSGLFTEDLRILRNEIYARRGRVFKDRELQKYFESTEWYKPNPDFKDDMLGEIEYKNLAAIRSAEETAISKFTVEEG